MAREIDFGQDSWSQGARIGHILYQIYGTQAVIDAVNDSVIEPDKWASCSGCESYMPFVEVGKRYKECICCGQEEEMNLGEKR